MKDALYILPKAIVKIPNPPLPAYEEISVNLKGEGVKIMIPSNVIDIDTRLSISLGFEISGHSYTVTEALNLIDEIFKRDEIQNEQQYRNGPDKFFNTRKGASL